MGIDFNARMIKPKKAAFGQLFLWVYFSFSRLGTKKDFVRKCSILWSIFLVLPHLLNFFLNLLQKIQYLYFVMSREEILNQHHI